MKTNFAYRIFRLLLLAVFLLCASALIVCCARHEHKYQRSITTPPTCTQHGVATYVCDCGDKYTEELPLDVHQMHYVIVDGGHSYECKNCNFSQDVAEHELYVLETEYLNPTCEEEGWTIKRCKCGYSIKETVPKKAHELKYVVTDETHYAQCKNCSFKTEAVAHSFDKLVYHVGATCQIKGEDVYMCECEKTVTREFDVIDHDYSQIYFDENCHWTVCSMCGKGNPQGETEVHTLVETVQTEPDCTTSGFLKRACACGYWVGETIRPLGHNPDATQLSPDKAPDNSNHYRKCLRCGENVAEYHDFVAAACPDNLICEATCYKEGHFDSVCTVCEKHVHRSIPKTDDHNFSDEWQTNGTHHWHACLNGDGTHTCNATADYGQHANEVITQQPTCEQSGKIYDKCTVCGLEHLRKNLPQTGHNFIEEITKPATCTQKGEKHVTCSNCDYDVTEEIPPVKHDWKLFKGDAEGHWKACSVCGAEQEHSLSSQKSAHTWTAVVEKEATCKENGKTVRTCNYCNFKEEIITTKNHSYVTNPDSYVDSTCTEYGHHAETCSQCGDTITVREQSLEPHNVFYVKEKPVTETQTGNRNYWQCENCGKYFATKNCETELTADEVFIYSPKTVEVANLAEIQTVADKLAADITEGSYTSYDYYKLTLTVFDVADEIAEVIDEDYSSVYLEIPQNLGSPLKTGDVITIKTRVKVEYGKTDYELVNVDVTDVQGSEGEYDLFVESNNTDSSVYVQVEYGYADAINVNTKYFNTLLIDDEVPVIITVYKYKENSPTVLEKVLVNGEAQTVVNGELRITVTGDLHVQLVFSTNPSASVTLDRLDTGSQDVHAADEYVSYRYTGAYNDFGRLYQGSHLTFQVNNANIVKIVITYQDYNLDGEEGTVLDNKISAGTDKDHAAVQTQVINGNLKVIIEFDASGGVTYFDYFADVCQARIAEITVEYATQNEFVKTVTFG